MSGISNKYPSGWPTVDSRSKSECPDISGLYLNFGAFSYNRYDLQNHVSLTRFFPNVRAEQGDIQVRISFDEVKRDFQIETVGRQPTGVEIVGHLKSTEIDCSKGVLWLKPTTDGVIEGLAGYKSRTKWGFQLAEDGSLVGQEQTWTVGFFLIVPGGSKQTFWYRWDRAIDANVSK